MKILFALLACLPVLAEDAVKPVAPAKPPVSWDDVFRYPDNPPPSKAEDTARYLEIIGLRDVIHRNILKLEDTEARYKKDSEAKDIDKSALKDSLQKLESVKDQLKSAKNEDWKLAIEASKIVRRMPDAAKIAQREPDAAKQETKSPKAK